MSEAPPGSKLSEPSSVTVAPGATIWSDPATAVGRSTVTWIVAVHGLHTGGAEPTAAWQARTRYSYTPPVYVVNLCRSSLRVWTVAGSVFAGVTNRSSSSYSSTPSRAPQTTA